MIFDTDVLIWALRGSARAARAIDAARDRSLSIVSWMELLQGSRSKLESRAIRKSLRELGFSVLPLSETIGAAAAGLIEQHSLAHGIQLADALIDSTAIEVAQPLCTGNAKHFRPISAIALAPFRP